MPGFIDTMDERSPKILFLAYYFPPLGGAGSQRTLKFVKYLPQFGWKPIVLSALEEGGSRWAPVDDTMCKEIDSTVDVVRVSIPKDQLELGRGRGLLRKILGPQGKTRWYREVVTQGEELCGVNRPDILFATMSPFETAAAAGFLSEKFRIPWVADLRDPWALDEWRVFPSRWHRKAQLKEMGRKLSTASMIIMNTPEAARACRETFPHLAGIPIHSLTNGYDKEDFAAGMTEPNQKVFTIVHTGALHSRLGLEQIKRSHYYKLLGKMKPGVELLTRSHYFLLKALHEWLSEQKNIGSQVSVKLVGEATDADKKIVSELGLEEHVCFTGYLSHEESIAHLLHADLLFLPMHKLKAGVRASIVPGKVYEYMASGRPVLAAVPDGDAKDFLTSYGNADICDPDDTCAIKKYIEKRFTQWKNKGVEPSYTSSFTEQFERRSLSAKLASLLSTLIK